MLNQIARNDHYFKIALLSFQSTARHKAEVIINFFSHTNEIKETSSTITKTSFRKTVETKLSFFDDFYRLN